MRKAASQTLSGNPAIANKAPVDPEFRRTARAAWARLIQKVYKAESDPLTESKFLSLHKSSLTSSKQQPQILNFLFLGHSL
jgi:hypothetical protein